MHCNDHGSGIEWSGRSESEFGSGAAWEVPGVQVGPDGLWIQRGDGLVWLWATDCRWVWGDGRFVSTAWRAMRVMASRRSWWRVCQFGLVWWRSRWVSTLLAMWAQMAWAVMV